MSAVEEALRGTVHMLAAIISDLADALGCEPNSELMLARIAQFQDALRTAGPYVLHEVGGEHEDCIAVTEALGKGKHP